MHTFSLEKFMNPRENINIKYQAEDAGCAVHTHEFAELIFVVCGTAEHRIDGVSYRAEAGDLIFVNYGQTHAFEALNSEYGYYNLLYVPEFFSEELINSENIYEIFEISMFREFGDAGINGQAQMVSFRGNAYQEAKKLVEDMYAEFKNKEVGYRSVLNGYSRVLFSKMLRKLKCIGGSSEVSGEAQKCINRITEECMAYIDAHCFEKISLKEIAEHTFYNPAYFSRIFKEHCGVSLSEYIKEKRVHEAGRLLIGTAWSIEEIMDRVGYTDKKQFYKNFRDVYLVTPAEFRKQRKHPGL